MALRAKIVTRAATWGVALVLAACTGDAGPSTSPSPRPQESATAASAVLTTPSRSISPSRAAPTSSSPTPRSSPTLLTVSVQITDVAGVRMGTEGVEAETRLRKILGRPDSVRPLPGCNGEVGRWLVWGGLSVLLMDDMDTSRGVPRLDGWSVLSAGERFRYSLPYGIALGTPIRTLLGQVPDAEDSHSEEFPGLYSVHTERVPALIWSSSTSDERGVVSEVSYRGALCD